MEALEEVAGAECKKFSWEGGEKAFLKFYSVSEEHNSSSFASFEGSGTPAKSLKGPFFFLLGRESSGQQEQPHGQGRFGDDLAGIWVND